MKIQHFWTFFAKTNNIIYMKCGYGDGGGSNQQIIKLDLVSGENEIISDCTKINGKPTECKKL